MVRSLLHVLGQSALIHFPLLLIFLLWSIFNGYTFVVKVGSADIYNSNNDNPMAWTAGDYISTEMLPDTVIRIGKLNNYLIAFGSASIEYFWDARTSQQLPAKV